MKVAVIGCGWLGLPLAVSLIQKGATVKGSTTSKNKLERLLRLGVEPHLLKVHTEVEGDFEGLFDVDIVVINIPPGRKDPNVVQEHPLQIRLLADLAKSNKVRQLLFVSSTGVYKNTNDWISEEGPCMPSRSSSHALLRAESIIRASGLKWSILRLAGLAGPERNPGSWFAGEKDIAGGDTPVNMVHLDDCINAIIKTIAYPAMNEIYNICADEHPIKKVFYPVQASRINAEVPTFLDGTTAHKIVDNTKFKKKFGFKYLHPDPVNF